MSGRKFGTYIIPFPQNGYGMVQLKYQPKFKRISSVLNLKFSIIC